VVIVPLLAHAALLRVDCEGGGDYLSIAEAAANACPGDTILVAPGTYRGPSNRDVDLPQSNLTLLAESGPGATVIDCESAGRALSIRGSGVTVCGFTFTGGSADDGGAVRIGPTSAALVDCAFVENSGRLGGCLHCELGSVPEIESCSFADNTAECYGGAVYFRGARPFIYDCAFEGNTAGINGGAISMKHGSFAWLMECAFERNAAPAGGAIYIGSQPAGWWDEDGEGTTVAFSSFSENEAERGGGVFVNARNHLEVLWCTLGRNTAVWGGAVYGVTSDPVDVFVQHSTIVGNTAPYGAGVCTAGWFWIPEWCEFSISRSIIAFNDQGSAICRLEECYCCYAYHSIAYGNDGGDWLYGGDLNIYGDPLFCNIGGDDFALCQNSQALPDNNPWGYQLGATSQSCGPCDSPVRELSWGRIKAVFR
jgi:predicted outer membrane repeat protein